MDLDATLTGFKRVLTSNVEVNGKLSEPKTGDKTFGPVTMVLLGAIGTGGVGLGGVQLVESSALTLATANAAELEKRAEAVGSIDVLHIEVGTLKLNQVAIQAAIETARGEARQDFRELARLIRENR